MSNPLTEHPASVGETYFQHLAVSFGFGSRMVLGGLACFIHGVLPFACTRTGSDTVKLLHQRMVSHRVQGAGQRKRPHELSAAE